MGLYRQSFAATAFRFLVFIVCGWLVSFDFISVALVIATLLKPLRILTCSSASMALSALSQATSKMQNSRHLGVAVLLHRPRWYVESA